MRHAGEKLALGAVGLVGHVFGAAKRTLATPSADDAAELGRDPGEEALEIAVERTDLGVEELNERMHGPVDEDRHKDSRAQPNASEDTGLEDARGLLKICDPDGESVAQNLPGDSFPGVPCVFTARLVERDGIFRAGRVPLTG